MVLGALLSGWRRAPLQLVTLLAGLALATALWAGVQAINAEARASYDAAAATLGEGRFDQIVAADGGAIPRETYVALRRAGWLVSPVIEGRRDGVRVVGLDPLTAPGGLGPVDLDEGEVGAFLSEAGAVYGRADALAALGDVAPAKVVAPEVAPGTVLTDLRVAARLLPEAGIGRLIVADVQPLGRPALEEVAPGLSLRSAQGAADVGRLTDSFHLNLTAFGALAFVVGIFIVHGAIGLAFEERRPVIRTLRALGVPLGPLMAVIGAELVVLALVAGAVGLALGYLIAAALLPDVAATLGGLYGAEVAGSLSFRPGWALAGLGMTLVGTAVAGGGALLALARMPVLAAARPRAWAMAGGRRRARQTAGGLALLVLAALVLWRGGGLVAGFAGLGALMLGGALMLPPLLDLALAAGARTARRPVADWFWADSRQQLPGLSLALMALLLAMAANVGVSTMVSSFRVTFERFLDQRLFADLYVQAEDGEQAARIEAVAVAAGAEVLPRVGVEATLAGQPGEVLAARESAAFEANWRFLDAAPEPWAGVWAGEGVLVNEQLARRSGLGPGDRLEVVEGTGLPILGVYGDYGNPVGQAVVGEALFRQLYPEAEATQFGISGADPGALAEGLTSQAGLPAGAITDQAAAKRFSLAVFERTFSVTGALNVLTLAVAGFAMLMSLLTLAGMRLPQLAPVWALGLTRARLGRLDLVRAVMLAAFTAVLAIPLGLALAWVLLAVINVEAFGWRLPMILFPWDYVRLVLLALVAGGLAALWPAWRLARTPPAVLLKVFSGER
ncbi:putative ABC-type transport system involved in lysophospholipase L1 biosynthesis [Wenxinia marina DSM 24838]|uniref:Putative ABC-type transport system involved in lysophospholipase L1 biosynthesis n=1 Tax=Wenxinia marina DSM 24838 TaxID=1123501 RepID=A0A0D0QBZ6_9RHOB|nr:putative ABC-type transport system involved in lysophospholipase L1 biosynthesis [Wenxinia marina DSM 24838]